MNETLLNILGSAGGLLAVTTLAAFVKWLAAINAKLATISERLQGLHDMSSRVDRNEQVLHEHGRTLADHSAVIRMIDPRKS